MSVSKRKLGFYNCYINNYEDGKNDKSIFDQIFFKDLLKYIIELPQKDRIEKKETNKKIYCLKSSNTVKNVITIVFQSGKYGHNPDYISSIDGEIRPTAKRFVDAEEEITHLCIKVKPDKAIFVLEERQSGMSAKRIIEYFNAYIDDFNKNTGKIYNYKLLIEDYPLDNIDALLDKLKESKVLELFMKKNDVFDEMKGFAKFQSPLVRDQVVLTLKAKQRESFPESIKNWVKGATKTKKNKYTRIRLIGKNDDNNPLIFDTEVFRKKEYIESMLNTNGVVNTADIHSKMILLIKDME
jgi:hypothetical protein